MKEKVLNYVKSTSLGRSVIVVNVKIDFCLCEFCVIRFWNFLSSVVVPATIYDFLLKPRKFLEDPVKKNFAYYAIPGNLGTPGKPGKF